MYKNYKYHLILLMTMSLFTLYNGGAFAENAKDVVGSKGRPVIFSQDSWKRDVKAEKKQEEKYNDVFNALNALNPENIRSPLVGDDGSFQSGPGWPVDPKFLEDVKCYLEKVKNRAADGAKVQVDPCKLFLVNLGAKRTVGSKNCFTMNLCKSVPEILSSHKCDGGKGDGTGGQIATGGSGGNVSGSKKSSGGAKVACGRHSGQIVSDGVIMHGLEQGINDKDNQRRTVIHGRMGSATSGCIQSQDYDEIKKYLLGDYRGEVGSSKGEQCVNGALTFVITAEEEKNPGQNCGRTKVGK